MKPATPLPWEATNTTAYGNEGRQHRDIARGGWVLAHVTQFGFEKLSDEERDQNAAYIVHACNAYPKLVGALKKVAGVYEGFDDAPNYARHAATILREIGEL